MAKASPDLLQEQIGYQFRNPQWLLEALTHSSFAREAGAHRDNEQLEFLGDAVLNFLVSVRLADAFPAYPEGKLSRGRSRLVAAEHLSRVALRLELGNYLRLGRGEEKTGGRVKLSLMVNALEALVAAIYRDGGIRAARTFVHRFILPRDLEGVAGDLFTIDYKSVSSGRAPGPCGLSRGERSRAGASQDIHRRGDGRPERARARQRQ